MRWCLMLISMGGQLSWQQQDAENVRVGSSILSSPTKTYRNLYVSPFIIKEPQEEDPRHLFPVLELIHVLPFICVRQSWLRDAILSIYFSKIYRYKKLFSPRRVFYTQTGRFAFLRFGFSFGIITVKIELFSQFFNFWRYGVMVSQEPAKLSYVLNIVWVQVPVPPPSTLNDVV